MRSRLHNLDEVTGLREMLDRRSADKSFMCPNLFLPLRTPTLQMSHQLNHLQDARLWSLTGLKPAAQCMSLLVQCTSDWRPVQVMHLHRVIPACQEQFYGVLLAHQLHMGKKVYKPTTSAKKQKTKKQNTLTECTTAEACLSFTQLQARP